MANTSGHFNHDIINNYFITGPADPTGGSAFFQMNANQTIYSIGNLIDNFFQEAQYAEGAAIAILIAAVVIVLLVVFRRSLEVGDMYGR